MSPAAAVLATLLTLLAQSSDPTASAEPGPTRPTPPTMVADALAIPAQEGIAGQPIALATVLSDTIDGARQQQIVRAYWRLAETVADYGFHADHHQTLAALDAQADPTWQAALAAADAELGRAQLRLVEAQHDLTELAGLGASAPLPLPADRPHVGEYRTRFPELFSRRPPPLQARRLDRSLPLRFRAIDRQAAVVLAARDTLEAAQQASSSDPPDRAQLHRIIRAADTLRAARSEWIAAVCRYNDEIAAYAVEVARPGTTGMGLVQLLIKPTSPANQPRLIEEPSDVEPVGHVTPEIQPLRPRATVPDQRPGTPTPAVRPSTPVGEPQPTPAVRPSSDAPEPTPAVRPGTPVLEPTPAVRPATSDQDATEPSGTAEPSELSTAPLETPEPSGAQWQVPGFRPSSDLLISPGMADSPEPTDSPVASDLPDSTRLPGATRAPRLLPSRPVVPVEHQDPADSIDRDNADQQDEPDPPGKPRLWNGESLLPIPSLPKPESHHEEGNVDDADAPTEPSAHRVERQQPTNITHGVSAADSAHPTSLTMAPLYPALTEAKPSTRAKQLALTMHWDRTLPDDAGEPIELLDALGQCREGQRPALLEAFWRSRHRAAEYQVWRQHGEWLDEIETARLMGGDDASPGGLDVDRAQWQAARVAADAAADTARAALVDAQFDLARCIGREGGSLWPLPTTAPHWGRYAMQTESIPPTLLGEPPMPRLVDVIPRWSDQIERRATAVVAADRSRAALPLGSTGMSTLLDAINHQTRQSLALLDALTLYNNAIARYVLHVVPPDSPADELAAALVVRR